MTPGELEYHLRELMEAQSVAEIRGQHLMAKLYQDEWERLFDAYWDALAPAGEELQRQYGFYGWPLPVGWRRKENTG